MTFGKKIGIGLVIIFAGLFILIFLASEGYLGEHLGPGTVAPSPIPQNVLLSRNAMQTQAAAQLKIGDGKQILFGDLHVHTTFSNDAFAGSLPVVQGEGAHPPADACDYARFCSALDFWSINDHAIALSPTRWQETKESIRQCNAVTDPENPDVVAFLGYEWTQADPSNSDTHYGHKNVVFRDLEEEKVPARPIYAITPLGPEILNPKLIQRVMMPIIDFPDSKPYLNHTRFVREMLSIKDCPDDVNTLELPADCREGTRDPATLFTKLDEGGYESIVIPHGNTWGMYTPPNTTWDKQLMGPMHDPNRQIMIEVFSGHGNSEEYRGWRAVTFNEKGERQCPEETQEYLPGCRQAGNIIKKRCLAAGETEIECSKLEELAQKFYLNTVFGEATVPGATLNDWLDSDQCRDCLLPSMNYRPGGSAQYALAISNFDDPENTRRFKFGFMASSDNHTARPGVGFKEIDRRPNTDTVGARDQLTLSVMKSRMGKPSPNPREISWDDKNQLYGITRLERQGSFFMTAGLIGAHSNGRDRGAIWESFRKKEVYGTSGDRILLWFDLLNGPGENGNALEMPMGSDVKMNETPRFKVRAAGAFLQKPGCPDYAVNSLSSDRLNRLCRKECYNPSDKRKQITRIEVIRIRPQSFKNENVNGLIEDVWLSHRCEPDPNGCSFEFEDPEFQTAGRDTVYYVRAIQEPTDTINAGNLRCKYDENGNCIEVNPCYGDFRTDSEDDCLRKSEERAWSSPIFIDYFKPMLESAK